MTSDPKMGLVLLERTLEAYPPAIGLHFVVRRVDRGLRCRDALSRLSPRQDMSIAQQGIRALRWQRSGTRALGKSPACIRRVERKRFWSRSCAYWPPR